MTSHIPCSQMNETSVHCLSFFGNDMHFGTAFFLYILMFFVLFLVFVLVFVLMWDTKREVKEE